MPFSNDKGEGFENKIAALVAKDFGATPSYVWWGQRRGFIRNTMDATLKEGRCDFVMGVPANYDLVSTTRPYYRSTYVFVYPKGKGLSIRSLDDQALKKLKIGVHLLGDDYTNPPPVHELGKRASGNVTGSARSTRENPPSAIVDAVAKGPIDVAIVWGPSPDTSRSAARGAGAGADSFAQGDLPFQFDISMGVKRGNEAARAKLVQILDRRQPE